MDFPYGIRRNPIFKLELAVSVGSIIACFKAIWAKGEGRRKKRK
jgi:hypothetical protein